MEHFWIKNSKKIENTFEKIFNPEHQKLLSLFVYKGNFLNLEADYENALEIFKNVLLKQEKTLGISHPDTLLTVNNLGLLYHNLGDYDKAKSFYRRSIEGNEVALGKDHPTTLKSIGNLALVFNDIGEYDKGRRVI